MMAGAADGVSQNIPQVLCGEGGGEAPLSHRYCRKLLCIYSRAVMKSLYIIFMSLWSIRDVKKSVEAETNIVT